MKKITKRIASVFVVLALLGALLPAGLPSARATSYSADTSWYSPSATTYTISTPSQLAGLSWLVQNGIDFNGKTVRLGQDIALNEVDSYLDWIVSTPEYVWTPIGLDAETAFAGTFDGQGHTISGLYIGSSARGVKLGLFGYSTGVIRNLKVTNAYLLSTGGSCHLGLICGYVGGGVIEGCTASGIIDGVGVASNNTSAGGIAGTATRAILSACAANVVLSGTYADFGAICGTNYSTISDCAGAGYIEAAASSYAGGLVGYNNGPLQNCLSTADVEANGYTGGVAGYCTQGGRIDNCLVTGCIGGSGAVGAVCGAASGTVSNCFYPVGAAGSHGGIGSAADQSGVTTAFSGYGSIGTDATAVLRQLNSWCTQNGISPAWMQAVSSYPALTAIALPASPLPGEDDTSSQTPDEPAGSETAPRVLLSVAALAELSRLTADHLSVQAAQNGNTMTLAILADGKLVQSVSGGIALTTDRVPDGDVAALVSGDNLTILPKSVLREGLVYIPVPGSCTVKILSNAKSFADVVADSWYDSAVAFVTSHELYNGVSETHFAPNGTMTRAMVLTVLWRLEGSPKASGSTGFQDVSSSAWYGTAVAWANANGILGGLFTEKLQPDLPITREELAYLLYRYERACGYTATESANLSGFYDAGQISAFAEDAMAWAVGADILGGVGGNLLEPQQTATRAQVAVLLERLVVYNAKQAF